MSHWTRWLWSNQFKSHLAKIGGHCLSEGADNAFFAYHVIAWSLNHVTQWVRYPHPKSQRLQKEQQNPVTKIYMYYKLGQVCVTNWGSFVLSKIRANIVTNWGGFITTNWGRCCYKLGQNVLQIGAGITNQGNHYKLGRNINQL